MKMILIIIISIFSSALYAQDLDALSCETPAFTNDSLQGHAFVLNVQFNTAIVSEIHKDQDEILENFILKRVLGKAGIDIYRSQNTKKMNRTFLVSFPLNNPVAVHFEVNGVKTPVDCQIIE